MVKRGRGNATVQGREGREDQHCYAGREGQLSYGGREVQHSYSQSGVMSGREDKHSYAGGEDQHSYAGREEKHNYAGREDQRSYAGREDYPGGAGAGGSVVVVQVEQHGVGRSDGPPARRRLSFLHQRFYDVAFSGAEQSPMSGRPDGVASLLSLPLALSSPSRSLSFSLLRSLPSSHACCPHLSSPLHPLYYFPYLFFPYLSCPSFDLFSPSPREGHRERGREGPRGRGGEKVCKQHLAPRHTYPGKARRRAARLALHGLGGESTGQGRAGEETCVYKEGTCQVFGILPPRPSPCHSLPFLPLLFLLL
ncbi:hypothetical protein E2C01_068080 [Portunus trituberculatus]|uniref:Uncharacterized protein n=1 Tax=Portunus trituberculatus TaxID=210409 RepID=A0A5B7HUU7_PORTR|nr:hypothetical protein [Portunus trituberculatus]